MRSRGFRTDDNTPPAPAFKTASSVSLVALFRFGHSHQRSRVASEARELGALDGAEEEAFDVGGVGQVDDVFERGRDVAGAGLEARLVRGLLEAVPGAHVLAGVAAVEPAFEVGCDRGGKLGVAKLYGRVRDAERGVHDVGLDYRGRRAGFEAERAGAAVVFDALGVVRQLR